MRAMYYIISHTVVCLRRCETGILALPRKWVKDGRLATNLSLTSISRMSVDITPNSYD